MKGLMKTSAAFLVSLWLGHSQANEVEAGAIEMKVYKSETCGCCHPLDGSLRDQQLRYNRLSPS
jgi:hypothetical protein